MPDLRLISAEILKLRRRYGLLAGAVVQTLGIVVVVFGVSAFQHASDPARHGPAGGAVNYVNLCGTLGFMAVIAGVIVGATAGTQDLDSGVFRDLAATGRSRIALFLARVVGAWAIVLPMVGVALAALGGLSVALAGDLPAPDAATLAWGSAGLLAAGALGTAIAVGVSTLVGSRGPVIGVLLAFFLAVEPLLSFVGFLGDARQGLPSVALANLAHVVPPGEVDMALGTAVAVIVAWGMAALGVGAWKTATREI